MKTKISIVVPVYNVNIVYFEKCINSIINQTLKDIEIIIIDDGSDIKLSSQYKEIIQKKNNITYIYQTNQGVSTARNNGIKTSQGKYIMFVDSDDWLEKDACEKLFQYTENGADFIIGRTYEFFSEDNIEKKSHFSGEKQNIITNKNELYKMLLVDSEKNKYSYVATPWAKLYKKSLLEKNNIFFEKNLKVAEDMIFNMDVITYSKKILVVDELVNHYRLHNNNTARRISKQLQQSIKKIYSVLIFRNKKYKLNLYNEIKYFKIRNLNSIFMQGKKNKEYNKISFIKSIINDEEYKQAIKEIDLCMLKKRRKVLVIFARMKFYLGIKLLYKIKNN